MAEQQQHPGLTRSGRKKKPDKWANILKAKNEEYYALLRKVTELEDEQRSLRVKEALLIQVLDILQEIVANAVEAPLQSSAAATKEQPADEESVMWLAIAAAVQQHEQEIRALYGGLLSSLYAPKQRQHDALDMLKVLCCPETRQKVHSMSAEQLVARLSALAGKCALKLLQESEEPSMAAHARSVSGPLYTLYLEFPSLIMSAMVWDHTKFGNVMSTNLDTQQPFEAELPLQHWLDALQQLQLSEQQLHVLSCMHDQHFWTGLLSIKSRMDDNLQQQAAHTELLAAVLGRQDSGSSVLGSASSSPAVTDSPSTSAGAACVQGQTGSGRDPTLQVTQVLESQEALVQQQSKMMRQWVLLGLHVAIVSTCTLSTYQLVRFVAACYPSIPRIDMAMYAYRHQRQQQAKQEQDV